MIVGQDLGIRFWIFFTNTYECYLRHQSGGSQREEAASRHQTDNVEVTKVDAKQVRPFIGDRRLKKQQENEDDQR